MNSRGMSWESTRWLKCAKKYEKLKVGGAKGSHVHAYAPLTLAHSQFNGALRGNRSLQCIGKVLEPVL